MAGDPPYPAQSAHVPVDPPNAKPAYLLTAEQLSDRWQVPTSQVYRLTRDAGLPVVRLGRYYRYRLDAVAEFERAGGGVAAKEAVTNSSTSGMAADV